MGLAASQARFLGITARKSNIEYEGQQVNQQRTALAEEVNSLYSKLLSLDVPVAPDATKFYESDYSFELSNTKEKDGSYLVKSYFDNGDGTYTLNTKRTYKANVAYGTVLSGNEYKIEEKEGKYYITGIETEPIELSKVSEGIYNRVSKEINDKYKKEGQEPPLKGDGLYAYQNGDDVYYIDSDVVQNFANYQEIGFSTYTEKNEDITVSEVFTDAQLTFDANNRVSQLYIPSLKASAEVNTTRVYDDEGYQAALRDYTMSKEEYDKAIADLNAQTESLQQEDKVLELRLNQIDTEQNELQTELEAVKQVLDKNIENTFKTFA